MRRLSLVVALGVLAAVTVAPPAVAGSGPDAECQTAFRVFSATEVTRFIEILEMLRAGDVNSAIERIEEYELGLTLAHLVVRDDVVDLRGDTTVIRALERARDYRNQFPRSHSDAEIQAMIEQVLAQIPKAAKEPAPPASVDAQ
jgi:hypothetical protein